MQAQKVTSVVTIQLTIAPHEVDAVVGGLNAIQAGTPVSQEQFNTLVELRTVLNDVGGSLRVG